MIEFDIFGWFLPDPERKAITTTVKMGYLFYKQNDIVKTKTK